MRYLLVALLCWTIQAQAGDAWMPKQSQWHAVRETGVHLNRSDGSRLFVPGEVIDNILTVKAELEAVSGVAVDFGVIETSNPAAYLQGDGSRMLIMFPTAYLDELGRDLDTLATTIGHELAHIHLEHGRRTTIDQEREADQQGMRWAIEAGYSACGVIRSAAISARFWRVFPATHPNLQERTKLAESLNGQRCE